MTRSLRLLVAFALLVSALFGSAHTAKANPTPCTINCFNAPTRL